jgi:hypothetical protein
MPCSCQCKCTLLVRVALQFRHDVTDFCCGLFCDHQAALAKQVWVAGPGFAELIGKCHREQHPSCSGFLLFTSLVSLDTTFFGPWLQCGSWSQLFETSGICLPECDVVAIKDVAMNYGGFICDAAQRDRKVQNGRRKCMHDVH